MFDTKKIISDLRKDLKKNVDLKYKEGSSNFFKETICPYGVRLSVAERIAKDHFNNLSKYLSFNDFVLLCEELQKSGWFEETYIAYKFMELLDNKFDESTFDVFDSWLKKYVSNWAHCDQLCNHLFGFLLVKYPFLVKRLFAWSLSKNFWLRRASVVSLILPARKGLFLKDVLLLSKRLKSDKEDLVLKGAGWLLRESAKKHRAEVYDFLMKEKGGMGRVMLRYAIEHFPKDMKKKVTS